MTREQVSGFWGDLILKVPAVQVGQGGFLGGCLQAASIRYLCAFIALSAVLGPSSSQCDCVPRWFAFQFCRLINRPEMQSHGTGERGNEGHERPSLGLVWETLTSVHSVASGEE